MKNHAWIRKCDDLSFLYCVDSISQTFPNYKEVATRCHMIPDYIAPSKCFNIKSYHLAVKSQQGSDESCKSCSETTSTYIQPLPHPSRGFQLIEYEDKCCSELEMPEMEPKPQNVTSKAVATDDRKFSDKSVSCDMINVPNENCQLVSVPSLCKPPPCLRKGPSSVQTGDRVSFCVKKSSSSTQVVLCQKCKEKRKKRKHGSKCQSGTIVYYQRKCEDKNGCRCIEAISKLDCEPQRCKYLDLLHKIKCIFTKQH
ncbi:hypothetical protein TcasGA2_TC005057 [Tribolium castaneum]|uniref:Uncharacterized protein n=1 Tax=Tribolium castaneum TaxID=7070 RepID=D7GYC3_TRICA|nr:hypothetical protein TcasGA2_TC005057 [Tribolium castaneum]